MTERIPMTDRILQAANCLFYQKGIRAVGVDAVAAEAGISKRSLYDTFPSKDALVAAYLRQRIQPLPPSGQLPATQILALFDHLHARFSEPDFRGCPFVNAVAELAEDCETARIIAADYKLRRCQHIASLLQQAGADDPDTLSNHIALLFEGAITLMLVRRDPAVALQARNAAATLMHAAGLPIDKRPRQHPQPRLAHTDDAAAAAEKTKQGSS